MNARGNSANLSSSKTTCVCMFAYCFFVVFLRFFKIWTKVLTLLHYCFLENNKVLQSNYPSIQFSSVSQPCPTLCDPMNCSMPGLPVHHQLPEFTQTHIHRVGDAIQPSHPLSSPFPPALNPSQHQSLFQ